MFLHRAERHRDATLGVKRGANFPCLLEGGLSEFLGFPTELHVEKSKEEEVTVSDMPVVCNDRVSVTVKVPQIQFIAESVDLPVVQQRRGRTVPGVLMAVEAPF